jgi:hypothetical protein
MGYPQSNSAPMLTEATTKIVVAVITRQGSNENLDDFKRSFEIAMRFLDKQLEIEIIFGLHENIKTAIETIDRRSSVQKVIAIRANCLLHHECLSSLLATNNAESEAILCATLFPSQEPYSTSKTTSLNEGKEFTCTLIPSSILKKFGFPDATFFESSLQSAFYSKIKAAGVKVIGCPTAIFGISNFAKKPTDWITSIVRFHPEADLKALDRALFSLAIQSHRFVQVFVFIQDGSESLIAKVKDLIKLSPFYFSEDYPVPRIQPFAEARIDSVHISQHRVYAVNFNGGGDHRATLINMGVSFMTSSFFGFLDFDDELYPDGYSRLVDAIKESQALVAVGGCDLIINETIDFHGVKASSTKEKRRFQDYSILNSKTDLAVNNFIAIHSYLVDRKHVIPEEIKIVKCLDGRYEDYEFLLRLLTKGDFDFRNLPLPVCRYNINTAGTNSVNLLRNSDENAWRWKLAEKSIEELKSELSVQLNMKELTEKMKSLQEHAGLLNTASFKLIMRFRELILNHPRLFALSKSIARFIQRSRT